MKLSRFKTAALGLLATICAPALAGISSGLEYRDVKVTRNGNNLDAQVDIVLDGLKLKSNRQVYITPHITDGRDSTALLPSLLVNGRNMHIAWQRGTVAKTPASAQPLAAEIQRRNGKAQSYEYKATVPLAKWMMGEDVKLVVTVDTCGCGHALGRDTEPLTTLGLNPWREMRVSYRTPEVMEAPVTIHEGRARIQFEVDRTELHPERYRCRNGQMIDNREQLKAIDDSMRYALTDPNVEIAGIKITGFASPESPYDHNAYLALNRSKSLVDYLASKYSIPLNSREYSAVPENWVEFRAMVDTTALLTPRQRLDLLDLIDVPASSAAEFDAKEKTLKTSPKFAKLYREVILPQMFPHLRATKFEIKTRLRPLDDKALARVFETTPELMSLNQMFRVANLYTRDSEDFRRVMNKVLEYYPDDETAATNAAAAAIAAGEMQRAAELLSRAGNSPEADNLRGIVAAWQGDFDQSRQWLEKSEGLVESVENLKKLN